jgi:hypothetical protein
MVLVTQSLTIGQLTFILRAIIQVLSLAGPFFIGLIVLSNATRFASFPTHDVINRIVGKLTVTRSSLQWIWQFIQRKHHDPVRSFSLLFTIVLLVLYGLFSALSDIGFLGFYACSIVGQNTPKYVKPASIENEILARSSILDNFVSGTDPDAVIARRCDSSSLLQSPLNDTWWTCSHWRNSTWTDRSLFAGINTTDSDMLIPRRLGLASGANDMTSWTANMTSWYGNTGSHRIEIPTIKGGILINPTDIGFQALFGVPRLEKEHEFNLTQVMALEVETGCMTLGISSVDGIDNSSPGIDFMETNGTWRWYSGPDILEDVLTNYTDVIREYWLPEFNVSTLDSSGAMISINRSETLFRDVTVIQEIRLPYSSNSYNELDWILGNCTNSIRQKLNLPPMGSRSYDYEALTCSMLGLTGSMEAEGRIIQGQTKMLCASTSQINMVSATVRKDASESISLNVTRIPSNLHYVVADYWSPVQVDPGSNPYGWDRYAWDPVERYTLSNNDTGRTSHYIIQKKVSPVLSRRIGAGSGGNALSRAGSQGLTEDELFPTNQVLDAGGRDVLLYPKTVTQWAGQIGASFLLATTEYNPWAALDAPPILVVDQGTRTAICYRPLYAIGFIPLVLVALVVIFWFIFTLFRTPLSPLRRLEDLYSGISPYWRYFVPNLAQQDMLLIWQREPNPHLDVFSPDEASMSNLRDPQKAVNYLALASDQEVCEL